MALDKSVLLRQKMRYKNFLWVTSNDVHPQSRFEYEFFINITQYYGLFVFQKIGFSLSFKTYQQSFLHLYVQY